MLLFVGFCADGRDLKNIVFDDDDKPTKLSDEDLQRFKKGLPPRSKAPADSVKTGKTKDGEKPKQHDTSSDTEKSKDKTKNDKKQKTDKEVKGNRLPKPTDEVSKIKYNLLFDLAMSGRLDAKPDTLLLLSEYAHRVGKTAERDTCLSHAAASPYLHSWHLYEVFPSAPAFAKSYMPQLVVNAIGNDFVYKYQSTGEGLAEFNEIMADQESYLFDVTSQYSNAAAAMLPLLDPRCDLDNCTDAINHFVKNMISEDYHYPYDTEKNVLYVYIKNLARDEKYRGILATFNYSRFKDYANGDAYISGNLLKSALMCRVHDYVREYANMHYDNTGTIEYGEFATEICEYVKDNPDDTDVIDMLLEYTNKPHALADDIAQELINLAFADCDSEGNKYKNHWPEWRTIGEFPSVNKKYANQALDLMSRTQVKYESADLADYFYSKLEYAYLFWFVNDSDDISISIVNDVIDNIESLDDPSLYNVKARAMLYKIFFECQGVENARNAVKKLKKIESMFEGSSISSRNEYLFNLYMGLCYISLGKEDDAEPYISRVRYNENRQ